MPLPTVPVVDPEEARRRVAAGASLLDVREPAEWEAGHAEPATWIPMGEVADRIGELPADTPLVVICRSGSRSALVTDALRQAGYDATNIAGGLRAWAEIGLPVVTTAGEPGVVA
jgi:rhodanese-related sulfurtransferase